MISLGLCVLIFLTNAAVAHESSAEFALSWAAWSYDPWLVIPLYAFGILFLLGTRRVWRRAGLGRGIRSAQVVAFWTAWLVTALVAVSPLHWLSERLFTAHMIEHGLLMVLAAPLFALARPLAAIVWSLPAAIRPYLNPMRSARPIAATWEFLTAPIVATALHGAALWGWHVPILYVLALRDDSIHRLQHLSFFLSALLFWWVLLHGGRHDGEERLRDGANVFWLFATALHSGLLGALMTLSSRLWYPSQTVLSVEWGLSPLEDQQLAGLLMWVPMSMVYAAGALYFASRWIRCDHGKLSADATP